MNNSSLLLLELDKFCLGYKRLQLISEQRMLTEMVEFFEIYRTLEKTYTNFHVPINQSVAVFTEQEYETFFSQFEPLYLGEKRRGAEINVWSESGLKQDEVRNTSVLSWWLDCNGSHGLGDVLFKAMLSALPDNEVLPPVSKIDCGYRVMVESLPLGERENRIDIEICHSDFLIFVEVKINAGEGKLQLSRYQGLIKKKANSYDIGFGGVIYLTRYESNKTNELGCISLSWRQLASSFRAVKLTKESAFAQMLLLQFCDHIESF